ncbi:hypothetical protein BC832DRAFT_39274 [Gaertneriomyces semiglobifer]|nr:hypothetical protein BC832DRAFT_39274 [Gaertneriomyces semiglobifer]
MTSSSSSSSPKVGGLCRSLDSDAKVILDYFVHNGESDTLPNDTVHYFNSLLPPTAPVEVSYIDPSKGKGFIAKQDLKDGDIVTKEVPWIIIPQRNSSLTRSCSNCARCLGSTKTQLDHFLQPPLTDAEAALLPDSLVATAVVTCECGEEYCSQECKESAWSHWHQRLCTHTRPHIAGALKEFHYHASITNEVFLLVLRTFAKLAISITEANATGSRVDRLKKALFPLRVFAKDYWWDVIQPAVTDEDYEPPEAFAATLHGVLVESLDLMRPVFGDVLELLDPVMNADFYALLVGVFERNSLEVESENPVLAAWNSVEDGALKERVVECISRVLHDDEECCDDHDHEHGAEEEHDGDEESHEEDDEDEAEDMLTHLHATATTLNPLHGTFNHSCDPSATIAYEPPYVVVRAIRAIPKGEEVTTSYLGDEEVGDDRRRTLREYGIFGCHCDKCVPGE